MVFRGNLPIYSKSGKILFSGVTASLLALGSVCFGAEQLSLDPGGVSVDLSGFKGTSKIPETGPNLLLCGDFESKEINLKEKNSPWHGGFRVSKRGVKDSAHWKRMAGAITHNIEKGSGVKGSQCAVIHTSESVLQERNSDGYPLIYSSLRQTVDIPDSAVPVKYTLFFMARGTHGKLPGDGMFVFIDFQDKAKGLPNAKNTRKYIRYTVMLTKEYEQRSVSFVAPPHTRSLSFTFVMGGAGKVFLDEMKLVETAAAEGANIYVSPLSYIDNICCIGEGQPGFISFVMQNERRTKFKKLTLTLKVPAGFRFYGTNSDDSLIRCVKNPDGSVTVDCNVQRFVSSMPVDSHSVWHQPTVCLIPEKKASDKRYPMTYRLSDGEWKGETKTIDLKIIKACQGIRPRNFVMGVQAGTELSLPEDKLSVIRDFLVRNGLNAHHGSSDQLRKALKSAGFARYATRHNLSNGYRLGGGTDRTEESYFRLMDGSPYSEGVNYTYTCPVEIYNRGKFYRAKVQKLIEEMICSTDAADHIMPNWELQGTKFKGCFCNRCREEFIRYMKGKAKPGEIQEKWPKRIIDDYRVDWIRFRSWQHGKICETLEQDVRALGKKLGKESHFIPEIEYSQLSEGGQETFSQYSVRDYMTKLPWIDPWGPYVFADFTEKYVYYPGFHLMSYVAAKEGMAFIKHHIKDPALRPKLIAMPHGVQGPWITEPEAIAFDTLCFFVNCWNGSICYYFPRGYDQRYWNALAKSSRIIAQHEEIVLNGREEKGVTFTPVTPLPTPLFPIHWPGAGNLKKYLPSLDSHKIWQARAFRKDQEIMAVLGNFWQKGELFARMQISGLEKQLSYTVNTSENYSLGVFSGEELEKGILVHAGALRWNFFRITPGKTVKKPVFSQTAMQTEMNKRLPKIRKLADWEESYAKKMRSEAEEDDPVNDFKAISPLSNGPLSLKAVQLNGKNYLQISLPDGTALLDPAVGGSIASIKIDGKELIFKPDFGVSAFWTPRKVTHKVVNGFKITGIKKQGSDGIEVELSRTISEREKASLSGMRIVRNVLFTTSGITITSILKNTGSDYPRFSFRFCTMPMHLTGSNGLVKFGPVDFVRDQTLKICRFGQPEKEIDTLRPTRFFHADQQSFTLCKPGFPDLVMTPGGAPAYGVIFWDTGTYSTAEPVYRTLTLAPGAVQKFCLDVRWSSGLSKKTTSNK